MKKITLLFISVLLLNCTGCIAAAPQSHTLTLYTYDSLASSDSGLLPKVLPAFQQDYNIKVNVVTFADTGTMLNQLIAEKNHPKADLVLGLDNIDFAKVAVQNLFTPYKPQHGSAIDQSLWFDNQFTATPFDFGYIGFVYDTTKLNFPQPIHLTDLANPQYNHQIILEQPGLSSPGTQLLAWTKSALGENNSELFWKNLAKNNPLIAADWNTAYETMFLQGEAPIVLSYLTSPAYHITEEQSYRYAAIPIADGYIRQVEGVAIVKGTTQLSAAQDFENYMLTHGVQANITTTQWMIPVVSSPDDYPPSYQEIINPTAQETLTVPFQQLTDHLPSWLTTWDTTFHIPTTKF